MFIGTSHLRTTPRVTLYVFVQSPHLFIEWWMLFSPDMYFTQFTLSYIYSGKCVLEY